MIDRAIPWRAFLGSVAAVSLCAAAAKAQQVDASAPVRPTILFNRWQEDWSVLADPRVPREPFDNLKYISLSPNDPKVYLSLGGGLRERFEGNDAPSFGVGPNHSTDYDISRLEAHADLRLGPQIQIFTQLESAFAPGKTRLTPVDQNRLDLEQAFVAVSEPLEGGTLRLRLGRQQIAFDLQRFVAARDGPNVRQSYDAAWGDYEHGPWRYLAFYSLPVQNRDLRAFDDYSSARLTYGGLRVERKLSRTVELSASYSRFTQDGVKFPNARGDERRDILDVHLAGVARGIDWDAEAMGQTGRIGEDDIKAWAIGSLAGYTFVNLGWAPRIGLQVDAASGDTNPRDHQLGTFNPLFPNGYYVTLAGYTGYVNFIHVKPSLTLHPTKALKLMLAAAGQWRETTADAVYTQPDIPVAGTAGRPGRYTGTYGQLRADWAVNHNIALALEAVHFAVGDVIRRAGGHDGDYLGAELKFGW
ncbi:MAG TPA: alginate export family protein [Caulobacteraceae bacterium]|jgi:hypothetical protein